MDERALQWPPWLLAELEKSDREMAAVAAKLHKSMAWLAIWAETPEGRGFMRLSELLEAAKNDPLVAGSVRASTLAALFADVAGDPDGLEQLFDVYNRGEQSKRGLARHQSRALAMEWVQLEWKAHADGYDHNKSEFARAYARRCAMEKACSVKERTIREVWLRGL